MEIMLIMEDANSIQKKVSDLKFSVEYCDKLIEQNAIQYESKITYISAGAIGAILVFAKNNVGCSWLLISGLIVLTLACLMNIYSYIWYSGILRQDYYFFHRIMSFLKSPSRELNNDESLTQYISMPHENFREVINSKAIDRTKKSECYNRINVCILFIGVILISGYIITTVL